MILDPLEISMRSWPDEYLLSLAGTMARTLLISDEIEPDPAKVVLAERLKVLSRSAGDSVDYLDPRG